MDNGNAALVALAQQVAQQQAEIDRLKAMLVKRSKSRKATPEEVKQRRLNLITRMLQRDWDKALLKNKGRIEKLKAKGKVLNLELNLEEKLKRFK